MTAKKRGGRKFGENAQKVNGKMYAMEVRGRLVVKLPEARVAELVAAGAGERFDPGHGRKMKEWVTLAGPAASWSSLAREARAFVEALGAKPRRRPTR